jgi:hypothetical protein
MSSPFIQIFSVGVMGIIGPFGRARRQQAAAIASPI